MGDRPRVAPDESLVRFPVPLLLGLAACHQATSAAIAAPRTARQDSTEVAEVTRDFLGAFDSLQWPAFSAVLSDSIEVFWPRADTPEPLRGRPAVEARFRRFFDQVRAARPGPPYLHLQVSDLWIRTFGPVGLVTFALHDVPDTLGRRTLVFHREATGWRLIHLHSSNLPLTSHP